MKICFCILFLVKKENITIHQVHWCCCKEGESENYIIQRRKEEKRNNDNGSISIVVCFNIKAKKLVPVAIL